MMTSLNARIYHVFTLRTYSKLQSSANYLISQFFVSISQGLFLCILCNVILLEFVYKALLSCLLEIPSYLDHESTVTYNRGQWLAGRFPSVGQCYARERAPPKYLVRLICTSKNITLGVNQRGLLLYYAK